MQIIVDGALSGPTTTQHKKRHNVLAEVITANIVRKEARLSIIVFELETAVASLQRLSLFNNLGNSSCI